MPRHLTDRLTSLSHLHPKLNVPVRAILVQAVFNLLFGLIYLGKKCQPSSFEHAKDSDSLEGPEVAFNAYISSCTLFLNLSYAAPVIILLIRGRKIIMDEPPEFSLGRIWGNVLNYTSAIYVVVTSVVSFLVHCSVTDFKQGVTRQTSDVLNHSSSASHLQSQLMPVR